jgi:hypothetical protein
MTRASNDFMLVFPDGKSVWFSEMNEEELRYCVRVLRGESAMWKREAKDLLEFSRLAARV